MIPLAALASLPASQWVMVRGCSVSESTEPQAHRQLEQAEASRNRNHASSWPPAVSNEIMPPAPRRNRLKRS